MTPSHPISSELPPLRPTHWQLRNLRLEFGRLPLVMGIVNVTPDSFSDGGEFFSPRAAIEQALRLTEEGADILDIGGESTRPYADPVSTDEELNRVLPVLEGLANENTPPISIDTTKSAVAQGAIELGAEIINDISGFQADPEMLPLAVGSGVGLCTMHMQGSPQTMQENPHYEDVVEEVLDYLRQRLAVLTRAGVANERICLDPGIGFGKTHRHNLSLMSHSYRFHELGCPLLVGHSRKGFLGKLLGNKEADRVFATVGAALSLAFQGVQVLRVHDVRAVREALLAYEACGGLSGR